MHRFQMDFEWEQPGGARGPELRATWARLCIRVDGRPITRLEDETIRATRDAVYGPLYPIAEWIVANWWNLLHEVASPRREASGGFEDRHNLARAAEGFALPDLNIQPIGRRILLRWTPGHWASGRLRFLGEGAVFLDREEAVGVFQRFVTGVIHRLREEGVSDTFLEEEWKAIQNADPEEKNFCRSMGRLGLDPYAPDDRDWLSILREIEDSLPAGIREEFLSVADPDEVAAQGRRLGQWISRARALDLHLPELTDLRAETQGISASIPTDALPWDGGYAFARDLRKLLGVPPERHFSSLAEIGAVFQAPPSEWQNAISVGEGWAAFINGVLAATKTGAPLFSLHQRYEAGRVFTLCRMLFEYLSEADGTSAIVSPADSGRQKRNRAFAAEFIAPAAAIQSQIPSGPLTEEGVQDLAETFGTSSFIIRHQIENHGIARIRSGF